MSDKKRKVPKLRFPGFTDDWEQRKLGDVVEKCYGGGTPQTSVEEYWTGNIPWLQSSNLVDDDVQSVKIEKYISKEAIDKSAAKMIPSHSIAIVTRVGIGKLVLMDESYTTSQDFLSLSNVMLEKQFMLYALYLLLKNEKRKGQGTSIKGITKEALLGKSIRFPKTSIEQHQIGNFVKLFDSLISLHQRKLDNIKMLKKSLLQKLFPKDGEKIPELRFPGFTDAWEQQKLGEVVGVNSGRDYKHLESGDFPVYGTGGYMLSVSEALSYTEDAIGIGRKGTIDKPFILKAPFWTVDTLFYCIPKGENDLEFVFSLFQNITWKKLDESTGVPSLSKQLIDNVRVTIPSEKEQAQLGYIFESINNLISLHQRKLDHLKELKKGLLQQMFV